MKKFGWALCLNPVILTDMLKTHHMCILWKPTSDLWLQLPQPWLILYVQQIKHTTMQCVLTNSKMGLT